MTRLPRLVTSIPGPRSQALAQRLRRSESPNVTYLAPDFPVFWERAEDCLVTDADDNIFLDMTAAFGVAAVGHCHPAVVAALQSQSKALLHGMGDVHPSSVKVALCERLSAMLPLDRAQVILGQNGSDAVEAALKTAILATGRRGVLAFQGGYHGLSYGALDATSRADFREPFLSQLGRFTSHLPYGCPLDEIASLLSSEDYGAILVEPIQGRGGIVVPPKGWLPGLRDLCTQFNKLLIFDEIFTGWGRTGDWFACLNENVTPDIMCVGKAMGGGMPISACCAPASLMQVWGESTGEALHTSTFLGNPVACAASLAAIDVLVRENLPQRARRIGKDFLKGLVNLQKHHPKKIQEARGRGLMLGLKFASRDLALSLVLRTLQQGLIVLPAGDGSVIEFTPPLTITETQIDWCLDTLDRLLMEMD